MPLNRYMETWNKGLISFEDGTIIKKVIIVQICPLSMNLNVVNIHGYYCQHRESLEFNSSPDIRSSTFSLNS